MSDESTCYGCEKVTKDGYYRNVTEVTILGKKVEVCKSRRYHFTTPSKTCYNKALIKIHHEQLCHICAQEEQKYNSRFCESCQAKLDFAEKYNGPDQDVLKQTTHELVSNILVAIASTSPSDSNYYRWPFDEVLGYEPARVFSKAIRQLWIDAVQAGRHKGLVEGANMLTRLKTGEISVNDFGGELEIARHGLFEDQSLLQKHVEDVVRQALHEIESE